MIFKVSWLPLFSWEAQEQWWRKRSLMLLLMEKARVSGRPDAADELGRASHPNHFNSWSFLAKNAGYMNNSTHFS